MEHFFVYLTLVLFGLCLGSFAGASVWRLRARQLQYDKANGEHVGAGEYKRLHKLAKVSLLNDRSRCLNCSYTLRWFDMIPLVSWVSLRGKCRKCHKSIGFMEPMIELSVAILFVVSYTFWPLGFMGNSLETARFVIWLIAGVGLAILFVYDAKWSMLPDRINIAVIVAGLINAVLVVAMSYDKIDAGRSILIATAILSGLYWILHTISRGKWIGFGDVKLGLGLALLLADWRLAFIALFVANLIGCLMVLPAMIAGKIKRNAHVPFGPMFIIGFLIAKFAGDFLMNMYFYNLF